MATDPIEALAKILGEHGPLSEDEIIERLGAAGVADADLDELLDEIGDAAGQLIDDRWVWLPTLLDGRILTHRLTADELAHDILTVTPDLDPMIIASDHFADRAPAVVVMAGYDDGLLEDRGIPPESVDINGAVLLAAGTLGRLGVSDGELVGVRLTEHGLAVERVDPLANVPVGERLAALLDDAPVDLDAAIWTLCHEDPAVFTAPLLPLDEIIDDYGLIRRVDLLAPVGFDFGLWDFERGCNSLAYRHDLDPDEAIALFMLVTLHQEMSLIATALGDELESPDEAEGSPWVGDFSDLAGELGGVLADPHLAEVLVSETVGGTGRAGAAGLCLLAETLELKVPRPARVACRWLRAVALERTGDVEAAEQELLVAESMDTDWAPVLCDLARFASDRGDAERGLSLLRRSGAEPDDPMVELLERHRAQPRNDIGRNDACWCGSGRKYKKCHLGREQLSLSERSDWLYSKATHHTLLNGWDDLLEEVGLERARYAEGDRAVLAAVTDPLVFDTVLFEGGAFEEFVRVRGSLLPDDERSLADQWLLTERSVFEVEQVHRGQGVTARDVRTGDLHEVHERTASRHLKSGQLICTRVLPAGDSMQFFGGIDPVELHERDTLIELLDDEPDPVDLVAFLTRRFAPPALANTEGDPFVICQATIQVDDPAGIAAALDDTYDRVEGEDSPQWVEHVTTHGMERIRAMLALEGTTLNVDTNSERRMDRVLAALKQLDPELEILDDTRHPVSDVRDAAELARQTPMTGEGALDPDSPEMAAVLDQFIRDYETKWLDESIPALDGYTPRQAADDPTRRADLIKLLDTFPAGEAARGGMDVDRLRAALGLE